MAFFNKKEKVPELPVSPTLPELPKPKKNELPELPSFPSNSKNNSLGQEMVKSAISDNKNSEENEVIEDAGELDFPPVSSKFPGKASIMSEPVHSDPKKNIEEIEIPLEEVPVKKIKPQAPKIQTIPKTVPKPVQHDDLLSVRTHSIPKGPAAISDSAEPIFIRIDKFQLAKRNLEQIKEKVEEMEQIIGKINSIKQKEEEDIKSWSEEVARLKMSISEIDSNVFSQI